MKSFAMDKNRAIPILDKAQKEGYGIPAMCCYNTEGILATVRAAEAKNSPAMILLFPWAIQYANSCLVHLAAEAAKNATVPVTVHLDHAQTPEIVRQAADMGGFDSIMIDMSHYEKEENLQLTADLTNYCHERGIACEAEPGRIVGGEDGVGDTEDLESLLTTPDEAQRFVDCGIDWLAPSFGNVHGNYGPRGIQLEYERLQSITDKVGHQVRMVLHGADPFDKEIFSRCIGHGVSKVNINKVLNNPCQDVWQESANKKPFTEVIELATARMQTAVEGCCDMLGSTGKA